MVQYGAICVKLKRDEGKLLAFPWHRLRDWYDPTQFGPLHMTTERFSLFDFREFGCATVLSDYQTGTGWSLASF
jgi:hypothetical protein